MGYTRGMSGNPNFRRRGGSRRAQPGRRGAAPRPGRAERPRPDRARNPDPERRQAEPHGVEDYLEAIYELEEEGVRVVQAAVARRLGLTRASVSEQIRRMARIGLLSVEERTIRLTPHGRAVAADAVRRHRMAERFLTDVLGLPWHRAHEAAQQFQSGITGEVERRMMALLGKPATCPHGNPIPGTGARLAKDLTPLHQFPPSRPAILERLTEDVELDTRALRYFEDNGLTPGARLEISAVGPDGTLTLRVGRRRVTLGPSLADNVWVRPAGEERRRSGPRRRVAAARR